MKAKGPKRKYIKRVYEQGREKTFIPHPKKRLCLKEKIQKPPVPPLVKTPIIDTYELPVHYGTPRLTLMAKDPFWLYSYWEIPPDALANLRAKLGGETAKTAAVVLRMHDVTLVDFKGANANSYFDLEVGDEARNWYINLWNDNVSYVGEIGLRASDGRFFALARSNAVRTPSSSYSPRSEQIWMTITEKTSAKEELPFITPILKAEKPSQKPKPKKKAMFLAESEIRRYYGKISPRLRDIISARLTKLPEEKGREYSFTLEGETERERQEIFSRLPREFFVKRMILGASETLVLLGSSGELQKGASDFVAERIKARQFFFELSAELIVYGRTEPDASVYLGDKKITLRNDGTFSLRFALPDGKIPLEFKAISNDKVETRKINTYVERTTNYPPPSLRGTQSGPKQSQ